MPEAKSLPVTGPRQEPRSIIDAILDQVEAGSETTPKGSELFRAEALGQLDLASDVDARLTLVSRRSWLLIVAIGLVVAGGITWAALTPSLDTVDATGRVGRDGRLTLVVSESRSTAISQGTEVRLRLPGATDAEVVSVGDPEWPETAREELLLPVADGEPVVRVIVAADAPLPVGTAVAAQIVTDESTVLRRLLDRG
ncbi:MAG: hypothetical protein LC118_16985 [Dehalococcoidia bacterium]|nr:hypothetical protein [Dehalococcoidia bacterium]